MAVIVLSGRINESGELEIQLPEGLPPGEVRVRIELTESEDILPLTEEEIAGLIQTNPTTGAEIVDAGLTGGWADLGIIDGTTWVEDVRRKRKERRSW